MYKTGSNRTHHAYDAPAMALKMDRVTQSAVNERATRPRDTFRRMLALLRPHVGWMLLIALALGSVAGATALIIYSIKNLLDQALAAKNMGALNWVIASILALGLVRFVMGFLAQYGMSLVGQRLLEAMRNNLFSHIQKMSLSFFDRTHSGDLISRVSNDISVLQGFVRDTVHSLISIPFQAIAGVGLLLALSPGLTALAFVVLPAMGWVINKGSRRMKLLAHRQQERTADLTVILQEALTGIRVVKSFAREDEEIARFEEAARQSFRAAMRGYFWSSLIKPLVEMLGTLGLAMVIYMGGRLVIVQSAMTPGDLLAFLIALGNMISNLARVGGTLLQLQYTLASAERLFAILDVQSDISDSPDAIPAPYFTGNVRFENVSFGYGADTEPVLKNISLEATPGEIVALVGPSGAGKSTFVNLIPRFYDVTGGAICIDGEDIRHFKIKSLRQQIAMVPQDTLLFSGSLAQNIAYGKPGASHEEIEDAARAANAHEFITQLPHGYDTLAGERGVLLSGGQRQRIAIARALLANPRILILDEATSSLDSHSEQVVQQALERLMKGRTTFIIAHRLSTIRAATKILVVQHGEVAQCGNHEELMGQGGLYSQLVKLQTGEHRDTIG